MGNEVTASSMTPRLEKQWGAQAVTVVKNETTNVFLHTHRGILLYTYHNSQNFKTPRAGKEVEKLELSQK